MSTKRTDSYSTVPAEECSDDLPRELGTTGSLSAEKALDLLPDGLVTILSRCFLSPADVVPMVLESLPMGSRALVLAYGIAVRNNDGRITLTPLGRECMELSSARIDNSHWREKVEKVEAEGDAWFDNTVIPELQRDWHVDQ